MSATGLVEYDLRIGDRSVTLLGGPGGWGEYSPLAGYPSDPSACRRAAEEAALLGFPPAVRDSIPVNGLIDAAHFDFDQYHGFSAIKIKLQTEQQIKVLAILREELESTVALRVDANGAWDVETAVARLGALARYDIELAEQPVPGIDDLARLRRRVAVPIAADECVRSVDDARRVRALGAADAVVLKVQPLGGVRAALEIADAAGLPAIPTSMMETSVGIAAGLALAAALGDLPYACGLATASMLPGDVTSQPLVPHADGVLRVRRVVPDADLLARYADAIR